MPYRVDLPDPPDDALDRLVELGALDADRDERGRLAALMPDHVTPAHVARALGVRELTVAPAIGRDADSVWILEPRPVRVGRLTILPATMVAAPDRFRLVDAPAFGTGLHPTTALCLEALLDAVPTDRPDDMLDVGTGSGVLALAALTLGVRRAVGLDIDRDALRTAAENARLNAVADRLHLVLGGADAVTGTWPLVVANVLAAPLAEMAGMLVRRVGHGGTLVLSGIPAAAAPDVDRAYRRLGMHHVGTSTRAGWVALRLRASW